MVFVFVVSIIIFMVSFCGSIVESLLLDYKKKTKASMFFKVFCSLAVVSFCSSAVSLFSVAMQY
jgi:hypothetical protein